MNKLKKQSLKTKIILLFVGLLWFMPVCAQDTTYVDIFDILDENSVVWVNQIPPLKGGVKKKNKGWLKRLIFGEKDIPGLQKPVQALPINENEVLVMDQGNSTIFIVKDGKMDIPKIVRKQKGKFGSMISGCLLPNNDFLFTDSKLNEIYRLSADRKSIELFNKITLEQPTGIAYCSKTQKIWLVETLAHRITALDLQGNLINSIGQRGGGEGEFNYPTSVCVDSNGIIYIVDTLNYRIQMFDSEGKFMSMFGEKGNGTGYFASPKGIATDTFGNIYIVDALFHCVQVFNRKGEFLHQFGAQGHGIAEFWMPSGIFIGATNNIYVADNYNKRIQLFQLEYKE